MNSLYAGMYMMFLTTKLTRTTIFTLLNQRYYNLLHQTIYQTCIFQRFTCRLPYYNNIVAKIPCYICWVYLVKVVFFLGTAKSTARWKQEMYECWVAINISLGWILTGNCTCMTGYFNFFKSDHCSETYLGSTQNQSGFFCDIS